jgi:hypothetical protein
LAVKGTDITESQKIFVKEILDEYSFLWPAIAEKILELEPSVFEIEDLLKNFGNRLILYSPGRVNSGAYDFMLGYELMEGKNLLRSYFFGYRNWQLEFYDKVE